MGGEGWGGGEGEDGGGRRLEKEGIARTRTIIAPSS